MRSVLTIGEHLFEAAAISPHLQLAPSPATITLRVTLASHQQLSKLIAMLSSSDYAQREKAVNGFAKQPATTLPFLRAARQNANADLKWWIDAALQEMESNTRPQ